MPSIDLSKMEAKVKAKEAEAAAAKANGNGTVEAAEKINHPAHYQFPGGVEVIDLAEWQNFNRGNIVKYACRAGRKSTAEEIDDLLKVIWYANREIQRIRAETAEHAAASPAPVPELPAEAAEQSEAGMTREGAVEIGEAFADLCGMPEQRRRDLVLTFADVAPELRPTWKGKPANIAGIKNPFHATLTTSAPGFYGIAWNDVADVAAGRKTLDQCHIWLVSNAWLGNGA